MTSDAVQQVCTLLQESLAVWRVGGAVCPGPSPTVAVIRLDDGTTIEVASAARSETPIRWWVHCRGEATATARVRPCNSAVGLLRTVREAAKASGGPRLRIAAAERDA
jgi:hypothetical protein